EQLPDPERHGLPRIGELPPHAEREEAADHEPEQARKHELDADDLVVLREDVLPDERRRTVIVAVVAVAVHVAVAGGRLDRLGLGLAFVVLGVHYWVASSAFFASSSHLSNDARSLWTVSAPFIL